MLPEIVTVADKIQENVNKPSFFKSMSPGVNWKSQSMRMIPEEFVRSTSGTFEHRVVCSVRWGNSWQLWLQRDENGLFMIEEDWNGFVDHNLISPNNSLLFTHEETMFLEVRIFKSNGDEIMTSPLEVEPETEPVHPTPQSSHQETNFASASASGKDRKNHLDAFQTQNDSCLVKPKFDSFFVSILMEFSAKGGTNGKNRDGASAAVKNPERYLLNPENPFFVKKVTKRNDVLYVSKVAIHKYGLKFGPASSTIYYLLHGEKKEEAKLKFYRDSPCFRGWDKLCRRHNVKIGDKMVCELELSGGLVSAVRVHFVK
ncbi:B3 domain-containing protein [Cardamine amara subsp. amara]|uniref:B3 domain-containing protein n=1 Tax=Cardamine amara subsp. amara TaxID=228776 RepID=A0ABD1C499_CARAN